MDMSALTSIFNVEAPSDLGPGAQKEKSAWILPYNSRTKTLWEALMILCTDYIAVITPYEVSFAPQEVMERPTLGLDIAVEIFFVLDIILNFRTSFVNSKGEVVHDARCIALHYARTWFFIDLVAAMPIDLLHVFHIPVTSLVHLLKTVRLLRLLRLLQKMDQYSEHSSLVLFFLMSFFALLAHWMSCIWFRIGQNDLYSPQWHVGWLYQLGLRKYTPYLNSTTGGPSETSCYLAALYFTLNSMTTVGFGNVSPNTNAEKIFSICLMLMGALMHALIFSNVVAIIQRMYGRRSQYHIYISELNNFMRVSRMSSELKEMLMCNIQTMWCSSTGINTRQLLEDLPVELYLYKELLEKPLFKGLCMDGLRSLALHIEPSFCVPNEVLINQGDIMTSFIYVLSGSLEVLRRKHTLKLESGSLIGCDLPKELKVTKASATVRAPSRCGLLSLRVDCVRNVMKLYRKWSLQFNANLHQMLSYNLRQESQDEGDTDSVVFELAPTGTSE